jgi:hypothetical protein
MLTLRDIGVARAFHCRTPNTHDLRSRDGVGPVAVAGSLFVAVQAALAAAALVTKG